MKKLLLLFTLGLLASGAWAQPTDIQEYNRIGGNGDERVRGLAIGPADQMYHVGSTASSPLVAQSGATSVSWAAAGISGAGFLSLTDSSGAEDLLVITNAVAEAVAVASNGDIYVVGEITGASDIVPGGGFANTPPNTSNAFIWKLDANMNTIWVKTLPTASAEANASRIEIDGDDNLYIAGEFSGNIYLDFNAGPSTLPNPAQDLTSTNAEDGYIAKLDSAGNYLWGHHVTVDGDIFF